MKGRTLVRARVVAVHGLETDDGGLVLFPICLVPIVV